MIEEGTLLTIDRYINILVAKNVKPRDGTLDGTETSLAHILNMCYILKKNIKPLTGTGFSVDKFSRWLGFIQAIMIVNKLTTVENERNVTRPLFTKV